MKQKNIQLSICIVNWNTRDKIRECLNSIFNHNEGLSIEVIVVDNASSDRTGEMIKREFPNVILVENKENLGYGKANNIAIMRCVGEYILLLNPDIVLFEPCFLKMIEFLELKKQAGILSCQLINKDGLIQKSFFENFPTPLSELYRGLFLKKAVEALHVQNNVPKFEVAWVVGACIMMKSETLKSLGGFDERYFMYAEDMDLCYRVRRLNLKVYYSENIKMMHYHGESSKKQKIAHYSALMQKESTYIFIRDRYGVHKGFEYRLAWIFIALMRIGLLLTLFPWYKLLNGKKANLVFERLKKHIKILLWGLGGPNWVGL